LLLCHKLRDLTLAAPSAVGRPAYLAAASSLVVVGSRLYVIADDELHLGVFPARGGGEGTLIRLLDGELPDSEKRRKRRKPDFEAQVLLPTSTKHPHGALLALGSGSKENRRTAVLLALDAHGDVKGAPRVLDLSDLFKSIDKALGKLNIEGAIVFGDHLVLLQRGNKGDAGNALISLDLVAFLHALDHDKELDDLPFTVTPVDLGSIDGVPWGITDASVLHDGRIVFTAVAENTESSFDDGPCIAAAVGILSRTAHVDRFELLCPTLKAEGLHATLIGDRIHVLLVTDDDDPAKPAGLWEGEMEAEAQ